MGYSNSTEAITRVKGFLITLKNTAENIIAWKSDDPKKLQYHIHCGLSSAKSLKYDDFSHLKDEWKIKLKQDLVIAERKGELKVPEAALIFENLGDVYAIITKITAYKDSLSPLVFTGVSLDEESEQKLLKWCTANMFKYSLDVTTLTVVRDG